MATRLPLVQVAGQLQQLQSSDIADIGYPFPGFKNKLINGIFDVWSRGNLFGGNGVYTADRWRIQSDGAVGIRNVQRLPSTRGSLISTPTTNRFFCDIDNSLSAGSGQTFARFEQRIEGADTLSNQNVTVSFFLLADTDRTLSVDFVQSFGTGGSPSSDVAISAQNIAATASWQKFTLTFALPSVAAKTFGTNNNDYLVFRLILPINAAYHVALALVQVEAGSNATAFEERPLQIEQYLCKRYFRILSTDFWGIANNSVATGVIQFNPVMRAAPTAALSAATPVMTSQGNTTKTGSGSTVTLATLFASTGGMLWINGFSGGQALSAGSMYFLTTRTVSLDAEL